MQYWMVQSLYLLARLSLQIEDHHFIPPRLQPWRWNI